MFILIRVFCCPIRWQPNKEKKSMYYTKLNSVGLWYLCVHMSTYCILCRQSALSLYFSGGSKWPKSNELRVRWFLFVCIDGHRNHHTTHKRYEYNLSRQSFIICVASIKIRTTFINSMEFFAIRNHILLVTSNIRCKWIGRKLRGLYPHSHIGFYGFARIAHHIHIWHDDILA